MNRTHVISAIRSHAKAGSTELRSRGLPHAASAIATIGRATAAIGTRVEGWTSSLGTAIRAAPLSGTKHIRTHKRKATQGRKLKRRLAIPRAAHTARAPSKRHRKGKGLAGRSPAQKRAFRKMIAARKSKLAARRGHFKKWYW